MNPLRLVLCLLLWVLGAAVAQAQNCNFTPTDIALGSVDALGSAPTDSSGSIQISCSAFLGLLSSIEMRIHIGEGQGGVSGGMRRLTGPSGGPSLGYQLYTDAARSQVLGSNYWAHGGQHIYLSGGSILTLLTGSGASVPIYARAFGGQSGLLPGSYSSVFNRNPLDVRVDYRTCNILLLCVNRTATFSFTVRANVHPDCRVTAGSLDFGTAGLLSSDIDASSTINVACTAGSPFSVSMGNGLYGTGPGNRQMRSTAGDAVGYQLYRDPGRSLVWGQGADVALGNGVGTGQNMTVHGRVPAQSTPPPGSYSDSVVVTVEY